MKGKNILLFSFICCLLTSCSWLGVLDANPYDDSPKENQAYRDQKVDEIRQELLGLSSDQVLEKLGKPEWINKLGNYKMVSKFRESQYVFDGVKKCRMSECGPIFADESWAYGWNERKGRYYCQYGFGVFLKNGIVVGVE